MYVLLTWRDTKQHNNHCSFKKDLRSLIHLVTLLTGGKPSDSLSAVNKEKGWNEFIRQILITLHENKVSRKFQHKLTLRGGF
jgi:hypothetical protein